MMKEPQQRISINAVKMWRLSNIIMYFVSLLLLGVFLFLQHYYGWPNWIKLAIYAVIIISTISSAFEIFCIPIYKQRTWRYEIERHYIQLKHGGFIFKNHLIIPIVKVQYVNTSQGPLLKKYGLSTVKIGTMAYVHEIPAVSKEKATELREYIAFLSGINERTNNERT
ncbi:PH domain-containing protein [Barrientosiimonas marina]|uniref:PH domain-containing protein n=1 Tax=Lentibacillus kimchii TaxID=1542911 RepID=A0ABW2UW62_9BACI